MAKASMKGSRLSNSTGQREPRASMTTCTRTTVSIGVCCVPQDCWFTDREILKSADLAKNYAKSKGKNCIAKYRDDSFQDDAVEIDA